MFSFIYDKNKKCLDVKGQHHILNMWIYCINFTNFPMIANFEEEKKIK